MQVSIKWLKDYIDPGVGTEEFCDRMIMSGSNLETCEYFCEEMENVVHYSVPLTADAQAGRSWSDAK